MSATTAAHRQLVTVQLAADPKAAEVKLPAVFTAPIRQDVVRFVHTNIAKNHRQAYAVSWDAGEQTSATSWGTGRAVARIPRVKGGGTHRSGQGAFGNMCRKGRMFAPNKIYRKWHRLVPLNQKRFAVCSALAATAVPALVMARGHRINQVAEIPLVVETSALQTLTKTKDAVKFLASIGAAEDVEKVKESRQIRAGRGKSRNRRYVQKRGPLVVYDAEGPFRKALRNVPGIEFANVSRLNLLQLAPGGHLGRFIIFAKDAFAKLDSVFGTYSEASKQKVDYKPPRSIVTNANIKRIMQSKDVQAKLRPAKAARQHKAGRKLSVKNLANMINLNPALEGQRRRDVLISQQKAKRATQVAKKRGDRVRASAAFVESLTAPS